MSCPTMWSLFVVKITYSHRLANKRINCQVVSGGIGDRATYGVQPSNGHHVDHDLREPKSVDYSYGQSESTRGEAVGFN